jgi:putative SOS response-associated peptidase YedK
LAKVSFRIHHVADGSYNIAPRQRSPVIRRDSNGDAMIETMQWGLIPHWTKHPPTGPLNTINARSEAVM